MEGTDCSEASRTLHRVSHQNKLLTRLYPKGPVLKEIPTGYSVNSSVKNTEALEDTVDEHVMIENSIQQTAASLSSRTTEREDDLKLLSNKHILFSKCICVLCVFIFSVCFNLFIHCHGFGAFLFTNIEAS